MPNPVEAIRDYLLTIDPSGSRTAGVMRNTFDVLYDGGRTGRFAVSQLMKTEKTHFGTLVEINMQREFKFDDGTKLDYRILGHEVDCKFSMTKWSWSIPQEARGEVLLVAWANDTSSLFSLGLIRAEESFLNLGQNRDRKTTFARQAARDNIHWLFDDQPMPENILLSFDELELEAIFQPKGGAERVAELFRRSLLRPIPRVPIETVAQQLDPMKRIRYDGGARSTLRPEGIVILGTWQSHQAIAVALGLGPVPKKHFMAVQLAPTFDGSGVVIDGLTWKLAEEGDEACDAPMLPSR